MYCVIYSFKVLPEREEDFIKAWKGLTQLIYRYEASLGSRLHRKSDLEFVAYAQWPSQSVFQKAGNKLPDEGQLFRTIMRNSCESIETLHQFDVVEDLLSDKPFS